jgi:hypothetical protein
MLVALTDSGAQAAQVLSNITGTPDAEARGIVEALFDC